MITEQEAKAKWCPFARAVNSHDGDGSVAGINRNGSKPDIDCLCIASLCMAWRFDLDSTDSSERHGYCGLAGKPAP